MLLQFNFSNHCSFEKETILDMRASGSNELEYHLRYTGCDKALPVAAIYGANASGKSSVFSAFEFMHHYVARSFYFGEEEVTNKDSIKHIPFMFSDCRNKPGEFEVYYLDTHNNRCKYYNYGFVLDKNGIKEEWLKTNSKTGVKRNQEYTVVFHRIRGEKIKLVSSIEKYRNNLELSLDEKVLMVSLGAKLRVEICQQVRDWFMANEPYDCSDSILDLISRHLPDGILRDKNKKERVVEFLRSFDKSIIDLEFRKNRPSEEEGIESYSIFSVHQTDIGKNVRLQFEQESAGTQKMFQLYQVICDVLENGSVLFADELDIKLHPLLMRNIILTFTDPQKNPRNAQLIFTTHNTIYLDMGLLRRDEIWFTEKHQNVSELYSLDDIVDEKGDKIRKDSNYEKNYLLGAYGAIPALKNLIGGHMDGQPNQ